MKSTVYSRALARLDALEQAAWNRLRRDYLVRYFGGCGCRQHNCLVNYENSVSEGPDHAFLASKSREYNFLVQRHHSQFSKLKSALWAKHCQIAFPK